jgi:hypothetical protein
MPQALFSPSARHLLPLHPLGVDDDWNLLYLLHNQNSTLVESTEGGGGLEILLATGCTWNVDGLFLLFEKRVAWINEHVLVHSDRNSNADCIDQLDFFLSAVSRQALAVVRITPDGLHVSVFLRWLISGFGTDEYLQFSTTVIGLGHSPNQQNQPSQVRLESLGDQHAFPPNASGPAIQE